MVNLIDKVKESYLDFRHRFKHNYVFVESGCGDFYGCLQCGKIADTKQEIQEAFNQHDSKRQTYRMNMVPMPYKEKFDYRLWRRISVPDHDEYHRLAGLHPNKAQKPDLDFFQEFLPLLVKNRVIIDEDINMILRSSTWIPTYEKILRERIN